MNKAENDSADANPGLKSYDSVLVCLSKRVLCGQVAVGVWVTQACICQTVESIIVSCTHKWNFVGSECVI